MWLRKAVFFLLVVILCGQALPVGCYAQMQYPPTGSEFVYCDTKFDIDAMEHPDIPLQNIMVYLRDIASGQEYKTELTAASNYNAADTYTLYANTTYQFTVEYDNANYSLKNSDGTDITSYAATAAGLKIEWVLRPLDMSFADNETSSEASYEDLPKVLQDIMLDAEKNSISPHSEEVAKVEHEESAADKADSKSIESIAEYYVKNTAFIENNDAYKHFIGSWSSAIYRKRFLEVRGNTSEMWDSLSSYDQACYSLLYLYPKSLLAGGNTEIFASNREEFLSQLDIVYSQVKKLPEGNLIYDTLMVVFNWHWDNWDSPAAFVNPFDSYDIYGEYHKNLKSGIDTADMESNADATENIETSESIANNDNISISVAETAQGDIGSAANDLADIGSVGETEQEKPKGFGVILNIIKRNAVTLIILVIVAIATAVVTLKKRNT